MISMTYIASCVFTERFPELSERIQAYVRARHGMDVVRCCVQKYKVREFEDRMPEGAHREAWRALPDSADFQPGQAVYSLCHNCNNIIDETHPGVQVYSLWELIDGDGDFVFPDYQGARMFVQDCWRARERAAEQDAVRSLLRKMNVEILEVAPNRADTRFCGASLYRPQPPRNPRLAPKHYVDDARGLFEPHTPEEQKAIMTEYCQKFGATPVACYCHYCLEGLKMGGANATHLAEMLFPKPA